uniref:Ribosome production factor 2 homolog n=1 Tax=Romanomermis culicivorax TaxID=13658 RepID=A0A915IW22_ROMCU
MGGGLLPTPPVRQRFRPPFGLQPKNLQRVDGPTLEKPLFPAAGPALRHPNYHDKAERRESFATMYNEEEDHDFRSETVDRNGNILPHDIEPEEPYRKDITDTYQASWNQPSIIGGPPQSLLKMPLIPLAQAPHVYRGFYDDESFCDSSSNFLDAQQKEKLPAWIREGLEKVQKEKMKQIQKEEEEKFAKEQEKMKKKNGKCKFESESEEEVDEDDKESKSKKSTPERLNQKAETDSSSDEEIQDEEEMRAILIARLRTWLTEILMTVTKSEIERIADEIYKKKKKKAQTAQSSASLATMLNLGIYGTDEEDESKTETDNDTSTDFSDDDENNNLYSPSNGLADEQGKNVSPSAMGSMDNDPFKRPLLPPRVVKTTSSAVDATTVSLSKSEPENPNKEQNLNPDKEHKSNSRDKTHRSASKSKGKDKKSSSSFSDDIKEKRRSRWDDGASINSSDSNNKNKDSKIEIDKDKSDRSRDDKDRYRYSPKKKSRSPSRNRGDDRHNKSKKKIDDEKKKRRRSRSPWGRVNGYCKTSQVKPKTQRGKRRLAEKAPKLIENDKSTIFVRGGHTSNQVTTCLKDLYQIKKSNATLLKHNNPYHPFEDETPVERFMQKYDCSLFSFGSHSKKRPHNLTLGRAYDGHILDIFEFGIENFKSLTDFKGVTAPLSVKPCLTFTGDAFHMDETMKKLKNLFIDFFRCESPENIRLQGLEYLISFTALPDRILMRSYKILMKKSGTRVPRVELEEMGPSLDLIPRRNKLSSDDLFKHATRQPKALKPKKVKNVSHDVFGTRLARVHVKQQNLKTLQTRKMKGLKRSFESKYGPVAKKRRGTTAGAQNAS